MNKLKITITGLLVACLGMGVVNAQNTTTTPATKQAPTGKSTAKKSTPKAATNTTTPADKTAAKPAQHLKKDGTPDMRYKENKTAKPATATPAAKTGTSTTPKKSTKATTPKSGM